MTGETAAPMMDHVYGTGDQLRAAASIDLPAIPPAAEVVVAGMGGSGMAARVGALSAPGAAVFHHGTYGIPAWAAGRDTLVVAVSYSGNTEETLSAVDAATEAGLRYVAVTTGGALAERASADGAPVANFAGLQPRAAVALQGGIVARVLHAALGSGYAIEADLNQTGELVDGLLSGGSGPAASLGRDLADAIFGRIGVIYGGYGVASAAAVRWKTQINENAKMPAYAAEVPELDHNELESWGALPELGERAVAVVMLRDPRGSAAVEGRMALTAEMLDGRVPVVGDVVAQGTSPLERFFSLGVVGDVASVHLADMAGVDATRIDLLEGFKQRRGRA